MNEGRWWDKAWNPVTGCTVYSAGCNNCWARSMARRFWGPDGFKITLHPDRLHDPWHFKKPRKIFVCNMGDLFHEDVPESFIMRVMSVINNEKNHTFFILTKRIKRMAEYMTNVRSGILELKNLWIGTSVENQQTADERLPILLSIPGYKKFISVEPMLWPISLAAQWIDKARYFETGVLDWIICGAETGPGARLMNLSWARSLRDQCYAAGVPFFFKSAGPRIEIPDDLKIREYPEIGGKS